MKYAKAKGGLTHRITSSYVFPNGDLMGVTRCGKPLNKTWTASDGWMVATEHWCQACKDLSVVDGKPIEKEAPNARS